MFITGIIAACGIIFILLKFGFHRIVRHDILIDIAATFFLIWIFAGTFAGMMSGLIAGAIISIFLYIGKKVSPPPPKPKKKFWKWEKSN